MRRYGIGEVVCVPVKLPSGGPVNPVIAESGLTPISPATVVGPVFVIALAPRTPN